MIDPLSRHIAVIPIVVGPLQVLLTMLPAILPALGSTLLALLRPATFKSTLKLVWRLKASLTIVLAVITGSTFGVRVALRHFANRVSAAEFASDDWPIYRGNAQRTGAAAGTPSPVSGSRLWTFSSEAKTFYSSPCVVGNRVYATSAEVGVFSTRGTIYCFDADTGGVVWKSVPEGFRATFSSPAVAGKYLVVGEGLHQTEDARITCLDVTRNGTVLWSYRTNSHVESSPAIDGGRVYVGAGNDGYYCFELEPDSAGDPIMVWHLGRDRYPDAESPPVVHEGRVYFGLGLGGQALVSVAAASGKELWRLATPFPVFGPPTIARGKVFIGIGHGNFVESVEDLNRRKMQGAANSAATPALPLNGEVWCVDLAAHKVDWRVETDRTVLGAIVAGEDGLFAGTQGGTVYSLDFEGQRRAHWSAHAPILASPALTESHLYVVTKAGKLFALDRTTLQPRWETTLGAPGNFVSSPAIARGHVYVGSAEDGLICVGQPAGKIAAGMWPGELGGPGAGGNIDGTPLARDVKIQVEHLLRSEEAGAPVVTGPAAAVNRQLFIPLASARKGVACFQADDDGAKERWFSPSTNGVTLSPAATGRAVLFVDGAPGDLNRRVHCVDNENGGEIWSREVSPEASGVLSVIGEAMFIEDHRNSLACFDPAGALLWRRTLGLGEQTHLAGAPVVADSLIIAATMDTLLTLDKGGGRMLWQIPLPERALTGAVLHGKSVLYGTATGITAHRLIDGARLWDVAVGEVKTPLVCGTDFVAAVTVEGDLVIVDANSGHVRAKRTGALPELAPLRAGTALLYATADALRVYDTATGTDTTWLETAGFGAVTSPPIMADSAVYFGTEDGFVRARKAHD